MELPVLAGTVDTVEGRCLTTDLREFCLRAKLSLTTAKDLFQVLRHYHPELPSDPRTPLQTPRTCVSKSLKRGKYVHLGLERGLLDELRLCPLTDIPEVRVQLHIDGMKVFKSSAQCLWPILARVNHPVVGQPFVVGVFCGFGKPEPLEDFLGDCVSELKGLLTTGLRDPRTESVIKVNLLNVICDTPARCYVRQVKAHNGYYGCGRHIRKLSSNSDDEDSPHQPTEPTGWPAPPPILQHSMTISSYVSTATISTEFSQQVQKDMADIKGQLVNTDVRLAALEKRNDFLAEQLMALNSSVQQMQATLSDVVNTLQRASSAGSVTSSSLNLPLCTEEAYENFLRRLSVEDGFANEAPAAKPNLKLQPKKKQPLRFTIQCSTDVIDKDIIDFAAFEKYLKTHIKVQGKVENLGKDVHVDRDKSTIVVTASIPFSKRYLKYLTKRFLKRHNLRDYLHVIASNKTSYELRFFNFETEETEDEDEN
ncbi:60S ribosomal protein L22 [Sparganum proliferum]